ncbi:MAG TPA: hypothetical protein VJ124_23870 [Pyrinomonadaceae bacterium]|nr:hypothetical protein [Pyrinomonadaceae bacterium]
MNLKRWIETFALVLALLPAPLFAQTAPGAPVLKSQTTTKKRTTTKRRTVRRASNVVSVPVGTNLKVRLEDTLSSEDSRVGDEFTATVLSPTRYDEATLRGHVSSIKKSGKIKGRTTMNLAFDSIELRDGKKGTLHGYVTRVYGEDAGKADTEGGVESGSRGKQTIKRAGIGAGAGAIIGAIAGGGKGAAIGLLVGGAAGAGSLAIGGNKELKIESGTEMLVRVTR